jgi:hypothetical protein
MPVMPGRGAGGVAFRRSMTRSILSADFIDDSEKSSFRQNGLREG